jgi:hypothetical protein
LILLHSFVNLGGGNEQNQWTSHPFSCDSEPLLSVGVYALTPSVIDLEVAQLHLGLVNLTSFLWIILYSVVIFLQWDAMGRSERK